MARRFAFVGHVCLGFLERRRQGLRLQALGFELGGRAVTFGDQCERSGPLAIELDPRALALGGDRVVHFFAQPSGCVRCGLFQFLAQASRRMSGGLLQLGSELRRRCARGLLHVACELSRLLADTLGRFGRCLLDVAADAVGLRDDAAVGVGGRVGEASLEAALPFLADGVDLLCGDDRRPPPPPCSALRSR